MTDGSDPNLTPWRPDLASEALRGRIGAERYVGGVVHQAIRGIVPMRGSPDENAPQTTELLYGETIEVFETRDGWAWGQVAADGYVGYLRAEALTAAVARPTHRIRALRAFLFPEPSLKTRPLRALSFRVPVEVIDEAGGYRRIREAGAPGGWIAATALGPLDAREPDAAATALRFLEVPYLWGGRSSLGLDCSGLAQLAMAAAGMAIERDTYRQAETAGELVAEDGSGEMRRGDLVFFPGHVGLALDGERMVHANAHAMCVSVDPVRDVAARTLKANGRGVVAVRRVVRPHRLRHPAVMVSPRRAV